MSNNSLLIKKINLQYPLVAVYDAPNKDLFSDVIEPPQKKQVCIFAYFNQWKNNKTLCLTKTNSGCKGCGYWWFNQEALKKEDFVKFLVEDEGLKDSNKKMEQWLDKNNPFHPCHDKLFIGPYNEKLKMYVKTITFWVNADQLSILSLACHYFNDPDSKPPIMIPFGSGCMQSLTLFEDLNKPQAIIGSMDIAMRRYLPPNIFAFTVTLPLFNLFNDINENSFLNKPFLNTLLKSRGGKL